MPRGRTVPTDVSKSVSAVSFGDVDLDANAVALAVAWTPPEDSTVSIKTYEMYLATDAAGSGRAPIGSVGVGTNFYGISGASSDTDLTSGSHVGVCTKSTLDGQTMPAAGHLGAAELSFAASRLVPRPPDVESGLCKEVAAKCEVIYAVDPAGYSPAGTA